MVMAVVDGFPVCSLTVVGDTADLHRMFVLLCRLEGGVDPMRERLEKYIVSQGQAAVEGCGTITLVRGIVAANTRCSRCRLLLVA